MTIFSNTTLFSLLATVGGKIISLYDCTGASGLFRVHWRVKSSNKRNLLSKVFSDFLAGVEWIRRNADLQDKGNRCRFSVWSL